MRGLKGVSPLRIAGPPPAPPPRHGDSADLGARHERLADLAKIKHEAPVSDRRTAARHCAPRPCVRHAVNPASWNLLSGDEHWAFCEGTASMIFPITVLLLFQLLGEVASRLVLPALPGPVLGMVLLLGALVTAPKLAAAIRPTANGILSHLSLLFVPAGVGVVGHLDLIAAHGLALITALVLSTVLALAVGALVFAGVAKAMGQADD